MLIKNGRIITWTHPNRILENQAIYISDTKIIEIGPELELLDKYPHERQIDARNQFIMPGNLCAHTHFYGAFARGLSIPGSAPEDFPSILAKLWWPLDQALDERTIRLSAQVCLVDAIRHGTTTLLDHHASPNLIDGSLDIIAEVVNVSGLRAVLCYEVTDRNGIAGAQAGIRENVRFLNKVRRGDLANDRVQATFGLHASMTVSDKTLEACREAVPDGTGFHIHIAEGEADQTDSIEKSGLRVVERMDRFDILGPDSIFVHAVHVEPGEIDLMAQSHTWVTHQPRSNMNNAVGVSDVEGILKAGVKVCLGNDGFSNDMWSEWKMAYLIHKVWNHDPRRMTGDKVIQIAVYNNADLVDRFFPDKAIGTLSPGSAADIIFVDYHPFTPVDVGNLPWHILFGFHESMITTTIVDGKILMLDRKLSTLDEEAISAEALEVAPELWKRYRFFVPA